MRHLTSFAMTILVTCISANAYADHDNYDNDRDYWYRSDNTPDIEVWANKGYNTPYYYGEDIAVYFRADEDCYAVVYDVDPSGEVNILFPSSYNGSSYVERDRVYRIPDYDDDFRLEVAGQSGDEHIFAVASYDYINPPDFMRYIGYDYGDESYYDSDYFAIKIRGNLSNFVTSLNARICSGPYVVAHARILVDTAYRHHVHYRYWDYDPYYVSSIWVGCDYPGSEIWIDGVFVGIAPILVPRAIVGYHWMWVYYGGYPCYQRYFYVPSYQRYYVDVRIDHRYHDYKFRRRAFRDWVFEEKKYRNENDFKERADESRQKNIRTRSLPASVVREYADRGVISKEAPIVKQVRAKDSDLNYKPADANHDIKARNSRITESDDKGGRTRSVEPDESKIKRGATDKIKRSETSEQPKGESRIIIPNPNSESGRYKSSDSGVNSEGKSSNVSKGDDSRERKIESRQKDKRTTGEVKKQERSSGSSVRKESSRGTEKKESRSSGKSSRADKSKERGR